MGAAKSCLVESRDALEIVVQRSEIERGTVEDILALLFRLIENPTRARRYTGRISLTICGYETDERPLFKIEEIRTFVQELDRRFPYWFQFATLADTTLLLIAQCVLAVKQDSIGAGKTSPDDLARFVEERLYSLDHLYLCLQLDFDDCCARAEQVERFFAQYGYVREFAQAA